MVPFPFQTYALYAHIVSAFSAIGSRRRLGTEDCGYGVVPIMGEITAAANKTGWRLRRH